MRVVIIEDEENAAGRLEKMLKQIDPAIVVGIVLESVSAATNWFRSNSDYELVFADIQLADGPSFEIFKQIEMKQPVIFTTAYDQFALEAFRFNGINYLLKPIKKAELEEALKKFKTLTTKSVPVVDYDKILKDIAQKQTGFQKRIVIRFGQTIRTVEISDVAYFYTEEKVSLACMHDEKKWPVDSTLDELEAILNPAEFFRINRQFIVRISSIESMQSYSKSRIKLTLNPVSVHETIVSSERAADFKEWLLGKA
ncbi:MAG TPA: LytTR family DNA-binding domain-containing protein [Chryseosolibacter sp.]|nr:LytTR family DNA-binding domain-containing protein [Chryseosolibacter sp.]